MAYSEVNIEMSDITGKLQQVRIDTEDNTNYHLNVSNLAQGIYFIKVSTLGETKTKQLIIK